MVSQHQEDGFTVLPVTQIPFAAYRRAVLIAGIVSSLVGAVVIFAWLQQIQTLQSVLPGLATMKFNTALGFVFAGFLLCAMSVENRKPVHRAIVNTGGALLLVLAALTMWQYLTSTDFGIDELVVRDLATKADLDPPGRMSIATAVGFFFLGASVLFMSVRSWFWGQGLALLVVVIGSAALLGYLFGVEAMYRFVVYSSVAVHTAALFVVVGCGVLLSEPTEGLIRPLFSKNYGGRTARILFPVVIAVPVLIGLASYGGYAVGLYGVEFGYALTCLAAILVFLALLWSGARRLNQMQDAVERANRARVYLAALVQSSNDAIIGADLTGKIISFNESAAQLFGRRAEDVIGKPLSQLAVSALDGVDESLHAKIARGEKVHDFEVNQKTTDGGSVDLLVSASPVIDGTNSIVGISLVFLDITEQRRADELFRKAVEASPTAKVMIDQSGRITLVNRRTETLFGYDRSEMLGQNVEMLLPERFRDAHSGQRDAYASNPVSRSMGVGRDLFGRRKDGSEFPVEIGLSPIDTSRGPAVVSAIVDVSDRKKAEQEIKRRTDELARSNKDLEEFAYVASHDLQEPLRAVAGFVQVLQMQYGSKLDAHAEELISYAVEGATRMRTLIDDLLTYSRVGKSDEAYEEFECRDAAEDALRNLATAREETGSSVEIGELPRIRGVRSNFRIIFQNLIGNAIKFRRAGVPPRIDIAAHRQSGEWIFRISDNGIGIEPRYLDRIFVIFQRLHGRQEYAGTGIGLALCKRIVEQHHGRIWAESTPGEGTVICFAIPASLEVRSKAAKPEDSMKNDA